MRLVLVIASQRPVKRTASPKIDVAVRSPRGVGVMLAGTAARVPSCREFLTPLVQGAVVMITHATSPWRASVRP